MPEYLAVREVPGVSTWSAQRRGAVARKSLEVVRDLRPEIQWIEKSIASDKVYCLDIAPSEALIREHAHRGSFPVHRIAEIPGDARPCDHGR